MGGWRGESVGSEGRGWVDGWVRVWEVREEGGWIEG